jgi:hypothetical protein
MSGILIYTAVSDADGTLGGLQRQGRTAPFEQTFHAAIKAMEWCSSDPLCGDDVMSGPDALSGAVCHACAMAPETSCEEFNRKLDRTMLVGSPASPALGFFSDLLDV